MTDVTTAVEEAAKSTKIADHDWLDANGQPVDDIEQATGYRYTQVADNRQFDYQIPSAVPGSVQTMFAVFGCKTKAINWSSQMRADDRKAPIDIGGLVAKFAEVVDGKWPEREGGGGGGRGYDLDKLVEAVASVMERKRKPFNAEKVRAAVEAGGTLAGKALDAKQYRAAIAGMEGVRAAYDKLTGKATTVDSLAGDLA